MLERERSLIEAEDKKTDNRSGNRSNYRLIAFDMDGTLLDSEKRISPALVRGIRKAAADGFEVVLSTGRCIPELNWFFPLVPEVRYVISVSGALGFDAWERCPGYERTIPEAYIRRIIAATKGRDILIHILHWKETIMQTDKECCVGEYGLGPYQSLYDQIILTVDDLPSFYNAAPFRPEKINLSHRTLEERQITYEMLADLPMEMVDSEQTTLEFSMRGTTKGTGLLELCRYLDITPAETIAVGDADNDLDILQTAGFAVAMGNANERVKQIADAVVGDNDHDGALEALRFLYSE